MAAENWTDRRYQTRKNSLMVGDPSGSGFSREEPMTPVQQQRLVLCSLPRRVVHRSAVRLNRKSASAA